VTLILVGVFFVIMMNLNRVAQTIEEDVQIRVHIDVAANPQDQQKLKSEIESIPEVKSVTFSSKQNELDNLVTVLVKKASHLNFLNKIIRLTMYLS
jgi:cell division transport system permease protein